MEPESIILSIELWVLLLYLQNYNFFSILQNIKKLFLCRIAEVSRICAIFAYENKYFTNQDYHEKIIIGIWSRLGIGCLCI